MVKKLTNMKIIKILLSAYYFLAIFVGLYFSDTQDGRNYFLFAVWLVFVGTSILITLLLTTWMQKLEATLNN